MLVVSESYQNCQNRAVSNQLTAEKVGGVIMMEKLAQAGGEGVRARPPLFTMSTITYKVIVYAPAKRAKFPRQIQSSYFYSTPYVLCG
jgi:hypothetical protein